jgi:hypothetical protein
VDSVSYSSGIEVVARRLPIYEQARVRQRPAGETEAGLFAVTCAVVGTWVGRQAGGASAAELLAAAAAPEALVPVWPEPKIPLPTPERDQADQAELDLGLTDPIEVLARRRGTTLEEAEALAKAIVERRARWNAMQGRAEPPAGTVPAGDSDSEGDGPADGEAGDEDEAEAGEVE